MLIKLNQLHKPSGVMKAANTEQSLPNTNNYQ